MKRATGIKWLYMDLNSYFASVEQQENPMLRGKPVIVVPMNTDYTCAIAVSYEAKSYGIKTGTMVKDAKKMCPNLHCVLAKHDLYVAYHHKIIEEIIKHTPINKICSIDELSSLLPPNKRNISAAKEISKDIKNGINHNIGSAIRCSIGFAPNALLAKIACEMHKPNGLTILHQNQVQTALYELSLTDIPGIGKNMESRLNKVGIFKTKQFLELSPKHARKVWGSVQGERLWYMLHGYEIEHPKTKTSVVGHSRVLDPNLRTPDKAHAILRKLSVKAAYRLRRKTLNTKSVNISLRTNSGYKIVKKCNIQATDNPFTLLKHIDILWAAIMLHCKNVAADNINIKKISVTFSDLIETEKVTDDLLLSLIPNNNENNIKDEALAIALDNLQNKYKKEVVSIGSTPKTSAGHIGTKIAFARVPDIEEFWN